MKQTSILFLVALLLSGCAEIAHKGIESTTYYGMPSEYSCEEIKMFIVHDSAPPAKEVIVFNDGFVLNRTIVLDMHFAWKEEYSQRCLGVGGAK